MPSIESLRAKVEGNGARVAMAAIILARSVIGLILIPTALFAKYPDGARMLLRGTLSPERAADFSPLYLLLNVALSPDGLRVLQAFALAGTLWSLGTIARRLWGGLAGVSAVLLAALALSLFLYEATLEPDLLSVAGVVVGLALLFPLEERKRTIDAVWVGVSVGLSAASRPTGFLMLGVVAMYVSWKLRRKSGRWELVLPVVVLATGVLVGVVPSILLRLVSHQPLGSTMSAGEVFQMGNRPENPGLGQQPSTLSKLIELQHQSAENPDEAHAIYRQLARAEVGTTLSPVGSELFWMKKALAFARAEPLAFAGLWGRKLAYLFVGPDGHDLTQVRRAEVRWSGRPWLPTSILAVLGIAGLFAGLWRRSRIWPALILLVLGMAIGVVFSVLARYRLPVVCSFCLTGGLFTALVAEVPRRMVPAGQVAACVVLALLTPWCFGFLVDGRAVLEHANDASAIEGRFGLQMQARDWAAATTTLVSLEAAQPMVTLTHDLRGLPAESAALNQAAEAESERRYGGATRSDAYFAAVLAKRGGRCDAALRAARDADGFRWAMFDRLLEPHLLAARCEIEAGSLQQALTQVRASLELVPGTLDGLSAAVALSETDAGASRLEATRWRNELFALHDASSAHFALADAEVRTGLGAKALENIDRVLAAFPDAGVALYVRARALLELGRTEEALAIYARALDVFPAHAFQTEPFEVAIESALRDHPEDPSLLSLGGDQAFRRGDIARARTLDLHAASILGWLTPPSVRSRLAMYPNTNP